MTDAEFDFLRGFLKSRSGLALAPEKRYLVESRLAPVCQKHRLATLAELVARLQAAAGPGARARGRRGDDDERDLLLSRQRALRPLPRRAPAALPRDASGDAPPAHLVRRRLDRPGALFLGHDPARGGAAPPRLDGRDRCDRHLEARCSRGRGAGSTASSRSSAACRSQLLLKHFTQTGEQLADFAGDPRHGGVPAAQPAQELRRARHVRHRLLPQRADLFRRRRRRRTCCAASPAPSTRAARSCSAPPRP